MPGGALIWGAVVPDAIIDDRASVWRRGSASSFIPYTLRLLRRK